jgi:hypothetical protein
MSLFNFSIYIWSLFRSFICHLKFPHLFTIPFISPCKSSNVFLKTVLMSLSQNVNIWIIIDYFIPSKVGLTFTHIITYLASIWKEDIMVVFYRLFRKYSLSEAVFIPYCANFFHSKMYVKFIRISAFTEMGHMAFLLCWYCMLNHFDSFLI